MFRWIMNRYMMIFFLAIVVYEKMKPAGLLGTK